MALDPRRTVAELRELQRLTGDERGAQRVAWTETWEQARRWLAAKLAELPVSTGFDEAGNQWAALEGRSDRFLVIGGHLDSVPDGGWLDGCLNVLAGLEVLRRFAARPEPPALGVRLVSWADEEGARFGTSLFASSAATGSLDLEVARRLKDKDGVPLPVAVARYGVDLDTIERSRERLDGAAAYLELHIEQGPVLESMGKVLGAVEGTYGIERHLVTFEGQSAHAGSTPMDRRRDAFAAAARFALAVRQAAREEGGVATTGSVSTEPGIVTAVAGRCRISLDQRHLDAAALARMLAAARSAAAAIAKEEDVEARWERIFRAAPVPFHPELIEIVERVGRELAEDCPRLPSGPLHDATAVARSGVPTAMIFVQSLRGLSHAKEEDTREEHLELAVRALDRAADEVMAWAASRQDRARPGEAGP
jgi:hydantoinase/carbamoylase family amidase